MKYSLCIAIGVLIGYILHEYTHKCTVCPEVKESIDSVRKQLPPVIKETEKPKPYKSFFANNKSLQRTCKDDSAKKPHADSMPIACGDIINIYADTLIYSSGTIISEDSIRGELLKKKVTFIPNLLEVRKVQEVEKPVPQSGLFIGAEIGGGKYYRLAPEVEYLTKKGYAYSYNFDVINNIHSVGVKKKLKF